MVNEVILFAPETNSLQINLIEKMHLFKVANRPKWTNDEIEYLISNYKKRYTNWTKLLKKIKHTKGAIIIKASQLDLSNKQTNWSPEEINKIIENYDNKKVKELAESSNRTLNAIRRMLSINKIKKKIKWHKHKVNHTFFTDLDNNSSYVLGLISADGCINDRKQHYSVELTSKDKSLLENVRNLLEFTKKVEKSRSTFRLRIDNKQIYYDIIKNGILPRKSKTIQFPDIPKQFYSHYIRGFFDGDGSIFRLKDGRVVVKFTCWSPNFLKKLQKILTQECKVRKKNIHDNSIVYYSNESFKILKYLYQKSDPKTRLDRKYDRYLRYGREQISFAE